MSKSADQRRGATIFKQDCLSILDKVGDVPELVVRRDFTRPNASGNAWLKVKQDENGAVFELAVELNYRLDIFGAHYPSILRMLAQVADTVRGQVKSFPNPKTFTVMGFNSWLESGPVVDLSGQVQHKETKLEARSSLSIPKDADEVSAGTKNICIACHITSPDLNGWTNGVTLLNVVEKMPSDDESEGGLVSELLKALRPLSTTSSPEAKSEIPESAAPTSDDGEASVDPDQPQATSDGEGEQGDPDSSTVEDRPAASSTRKGSAPQGPVQTYTNPLVRSRRNKGKKAQ